MKRSRQQSVSPMGAGPEHGSSGQGVSHVGLVAVSVVVLLAIGTSAYLLLERIQRLDERVVGFDARVDEIGAQVEEAVDLANQAAVTSEEARIRAVEAEEKATVAAAGSQAAEQARARAEINLAEAEAVAATAREEAEDARQEAERLQREREAELDRLQEILSGIVETRRTALGLVMDLGTDAIEFDFDRADLGPEERELLSRIAGVLLTSTGYSVYVYGHTDDVGSPDYNLRLSERRAESVRDYLVRSGLSERIITTQGYGQSSPRAEGTSPAARARNRRVEIGIVDVTLDYQGEVPDQ